jgi:hypothetical protein
MGGKITNLMAISGRAAQGPNDPRPAAVRLSDCLSDLDIGGARRFRSRFPLAYCRRCDLREWQWANSAWLCAIRRRPDTLAHIFPGPNFIRARRVDIGNRKGMHALDFGDLLLAHRPCQSRKLFRAFCQRTPRPVRYRFRHG